MWEFDEQHRVKLEVDLEASLQYAQQLDPEVLILASEDILQGLKDRLLGWLGAGRPVPGTYPQEYFCEGDDIPHKLLMEWVDEGIPDLPEPYKSLMRQWHALQLDLCGLAGEIFKQLIVAPMDLMPFLAATIRHWSLPQLEPNVLKYVLLPNGKWRVEFDPKFLSSSNQFGECPENMKIVLGCLLPQDCYPNSLLGALMSSLWMNTCLVSASHADAQGCALPPNPWHALDWDARESIATLCIMSWQGHPPPEHAVNYLSRATGIHAQGIIRMGTPPWDARDWLMTIRV